MLPSILKAEPKQESNVMRKFIMGMALALSLSFAAAASADSVSTDFESMAPGSVNTQENWKALGTLAGGGNYDEEVLASLNLPGGFGDQSLRMSSETADGAFEGWVYSKPVEQPASENQNQGFEAGFQFKALEQVRGSHLSISPSDAHGHRMSYVRLENTLDGVQVFFVDNPNAYVNDVQGSRWIATLNPSQTHTIKFVMSLVPGEDNDVVNIYVDGKLKACGNSWENYYRYNEYDENKGGDAPNYLSPIDRLIIQARGSSTDFGETPEQDRGFLIDNVTTDTHMHGDAFDCPLPVGPPGEKGDKGNSGATGTNGVNGGNGATGTNGAVGTNGTTTIVRESTIGPKLIGNTLRTLRVPSIKGMKLVSVRGSLRNKSLPVHGRTIKVDLRGKVVGNYNVFIVAKHRTKSGKIHTVRSTRSLSVTRAKLGS
jgi:hypothetical protein